MGGFSWLVYSAFLMQAAIAVKVKVVMHSDQDDSKIEEENSSHTEILDYKNRHITMLPFIKARKPQEKIEPEYEEDKFTTEKAKPQHPNEMIFPLIYSQNHISSMFKFGDNWYTWSTENRSDGTKAVSYYVCYDEPKRCDDIGWEHTEAVPKCAFQIDSLLTDDRACINSFGIEPRSGSACDGAEQMKVGDMVKSCGPRIRSLWRFVRVGHRPSNVAKPADVNSLICEDEEECFISIEYRIHHDRITFSLHEPSRGQTFKSVLKRETAEEEKTTTTTETHRETHRNKKSERDGEIKNKFHIRHKSKAEGKGIVKERNDSSGYGNRRIKNKIKIREDISDDISE